MIITQHHLTPRHSLISREERYRLHGHRSCVIWLTGLSGAGKSTIAIMLERELFLKGKNAYILDGDNLRLGLNHDLGFTEVDRRENMRRVSEVARLFMDAGLFVIVAMISPFRAERNKARSLFEEDEYIEVYVQCSLEECERRDPKGLYKQARNGIITSFTGITSPYEPPLEHELTVDTMQLTPEEAVNAIMNELDERGLLDLHAKSLTLGRD